MYDSRVVIYDHRSFGYWLLSPWISLDCTVANLINVLPLIVNYNSRVVLLINFLVSHS